MEDKILLAHGSGGRMSHRLIDELFLQAFRNNLLEQMGDSAVFEGRGRMAFTTDGYVVNPIFFPGGDIGKLAISGTVNDLSMAGAFPAFLSAAFIIEEGFPLEDLNRIVESMRATAAEAGVLVATGDTKVVNRGAADRVFITTAGVGFIPEEIDLSPSLVRPGDLVLVNGPIGDHGVAVMSKREGLSFQTELQSDCAPLNGLVQAMLESGGRVNWMRDPTRGGLATTLNELAQSSCLGVQLREADIPVREPVQAACEMLGLDPLYVANEGKVVAVVAPETAQLVLDAMWRHKYGSEARVIGEVVETPARRVFLKTAIGTTRIVDMLVGEMLPRIC